MTNHHAGLFANSTLLLVAPAILILASAHPLCAQRGGRNRQAEANARTNQSALNEWRRTHLTEEINKQFEQKRVSLLPQIKEDFTRIQVVNNAMMRKVFEEEVLDYNQISNSIAEIKKRAGRLKENLMLPEGTDKENLPRLLNAPVSAHVKDSLLTLDTLIMSFVKNPLFQQPGVIDAKLSAQAGRDLKMIFEFSNGIKKEIEKLSKLQGRP